MEIISFVDSVRKTLSIIFVIMFGFESEQEASFANVFKLFLKNHKLDSPTVACCQ